EKAQLIVWSTVSQVVIESSTHNYYSCVILDPQSCWKPISPDQFEHYTPGLIWQPAGSLAPPELPRATTISYVVEPLGEITVFAAYAIKDDGTVWSWALGTSIYDYVFDLLAPICVGTVGLMVSLIVAVVVARRTRSQLLASAGAR